MTRRTSLFLHLVLCGALWAQDAPPAPPVEEPEAPAALFDQKVGDVGVVLEADGTWTTRLAGGWGQGYSPQGALPGLGYPGFEKGGVFTQEPDFSLTLRLLERYYLEVVYGGTLDDRTFLVGYDGKPGEFLQWAKLGNVPFSVPPRAGQTLAQGRKGAPAVGASFLAGPVQFETLGRYEDGARETRTFRGYRDTQAAKVALDEWIRGRFFRIPADAAPITGVRVLSLGETWSLASSAEAVIDGSEIRLAAPAARRYLVTWDGAASWSPSTTALLGLAVPATEIPAGFSGTWYVLTTPGSPSYFEERNRYAVGKGVTEPVQLVDDQGSAVSGYEITQSPALDWFVVSGAEEAPFFSKVPGIYPSTSASPPPATNVLPWSFRLPVTAATSYSLGTGLIASSLVVVRNGTTTTDYRFDAASGILRFNTPIYETDLVEISYQRATTANKASDLVLWQAGRWDTAPGHGVEWALQGRWNMEKNRYTTEDLQSPGRMGLSLSYAGSEGEWSWKAAATGGALLSDSTGHRRLYGMPDGGAQATLNGDSLRPSALPVGSGLTLTEGNRVPLVFRNYWQNDPLTGEPQVSAWGTPGVDPEPLQTDGWMGPYLVRGDGVRDDRLAVMEATLNSGQWAGMQIYLDQGKPRDLKATSAISVTVRIPASLGSAQLFLQAGSLSDNWDGTGLIRKLQYRSMPALEFYDQTRGRRQFFPVPEGSAWGNDTGDGSAGSDGSLVTREITSAINTSATDWQTVRLQLTNAERQLLQRTTGWRLVLVAGSTVTQTVLTGPVVFEGSTWSVTASGSGSVNPVEQLDPDDQDRRLLKINWASPDDWTVEGRHSPVRPASYRSLAFRYKLSGTSGSPSLTVRLGDASTGVQAQWTPANTSDWVYALVDLRAKTLTIDGAEVGTVTSTGRGTAWDRFSIAQSGASSGTLLVSEIEAVDPVWEPVATTQFSTVWKQTKPWPETAPVFSGFTWTALSQQSGVTSDDLMWRGTTTLAGSVGPVRASGEAAFLTADGVQEGHGAYEATLPLGGGEGPRVEWTEQFNDYGLRSERLVAAAPWLGTWTGQVTAKGPPVALDQEYKAGWSAAFPGAPDWNTSVSARWSQYRPADIPLTGFASLWTESWSWLPPPSTLAPFYLLEDQWDANGVIGPVAAEFKAQNHVSQSVGPTVDWTAWGDWGTRFPYKPAPGWTIIPSVTKSVESVYQGIKLEPGDSISRATGMLWTPPGLGSPPFAESFTDTWAPADAALKSAKYTSGAGLDWERPAASDWTDLVLPASAGTKFSTLRGLEGTAEYRSHEVSAHGEAKGLNLFGSVGATPVFTWYRTDVWTWAATGRWSDGTRAEDQNADASLTTRSELVLTPEESIAVPVTYQGRWGTTAGHTIGTKPSWSLRRPADLPFELPRWLSPSSFRRQWVQTLGLSVDLGWQPDPAPLLRDLQVTWKGSFLLSEKSTLSLTTRWGQQWQNDLTVIGLEASLDLVLNF